MDCFALERKFVCDFRLIYDLPRGPFKFVSDLTKTISAQSKCSHFRHFFFPLEFIPSRRFKYYIL